MASADDFLDSGPSADAFLDASPAQNPVQAAPQPSSYSFSDFLKSVGSAAVRPLARAVTGLPLMALDAGISAGNFLKNPHIPSLSQFNPFSATGWQQQGTPLASQVFNQALDKYTQAPTTLPGKLAEFGSTMLAGSQLPIGELPQGAPSGFVSANKAMRNQVLQKAQDEGYVVPPASNNPTFMNRLLEGISGKLKLQQEAAMRNQSVTDSLAARALGQNPDMPLTQGALQAIRSEAAEAGYAPLRNLTTSDNVLGANAANMYKDLSNFTPGDIKTDPQFLNELRDITGISRNASNSFPGLTPPSPIDNVVKSLSQDKFNISDGLDAMASLRGRADDAFRAGNGILGKQYKAAANAVESMIERHLSSSEDSAGLLDTFRAARQQIAQTYTAGKAIVGDTGSSNALKYAQELARNKPLVGDQRTIASFASQFRKAAAFQTESMPSVSPLDAYGSAIAASASQSAAPLLVPLSRVGIREYLLSQAGQARAIPQAFKTPTTLGATGGLSSLYGDVSSFFQ